ncbi:hypothetical protein E2C01_027816 [Portunus trituberculatus]|uniref:Uncharacterized protein n=1 Tax=Portunus trituberculatus TaxID=210409 RepID=A0A5B7EMC2_PORTR|nr:hypothetical protein [Portunus trituberculatus]
MTCSRLGSFRTSFHHCHSRCLEYASPLCWRHLLRGLSHGDSAELHWWWQITDFQQYRILYHVGDGCLPGFQLPERHESPYIVGSYISHLFTGLVFVFGTAGVRYKALLFAGGTFSSSEVLPLVILQGCNGGGRSLILRLRGSFIMWEMAAFQGSSSLRDRRVCT